MCTIGLLVGVSSDKSNIKNNMASKMTSIAANMAAMAVHLQKKNYCSPYFFLLNAQRKKSQKGLDRQNKLWTTTVAINLYLLLYGSKKQNVLVYVTVPES